MARQYAIDGLPGLKGGVVTHTDEGIIEPGDFLPEGTETFDLTYYYYATPADIAAGAEPGSRLNVTLQNIGMGVSNAEIVRMIMKLRAINRQLEQFGSEGVQLTLADVA